MGRWGAWLCGNSHVTPASVRVDHVLSAPRFVTHFPSVKPSFLPESDAHENVRRAVLLTDGDVVFQPRKVDRSGLYQAVQGNVLIYVHKERELADVEARYPAEHYIIADDKLAILTAVKKIWKSRVTTIFVRQGHYARDPGILARNPDPDVRVDRIGDLLRWERGGLP